MAKTALVTGILGQDGAYLAEYLQARGYLVLGLVRPGAVSSGSGLEHFEWDMHDPAALGEILRACQPDEFYNFAAYSSGAGMFDDPVAIGDINGLAVVRMLESIRAHSPATRFCQASSREVFGEATESPQTEMTRRSPRSPYGAAKAYADAMVQVYRQHYGLFACSAILFNHESPRRRLEFVTRKITHTVARIHLGMAGELQLGNLDALRDWGFAGDYVRAMWLALQAETPDDYVVATGEMHSVRQFCEYAFAHVGLDYRDYVREDAAAWRPAEPVPLRGDYSRIRDRLGWSPTTGLRELVAMMVDADIRLLGRNHHA